MKVYIITNESFPNGMAATKRILCYAKGLIANNIDCEVIIVNRTEKQNKPMGNTQGVGIVQGVPFHYIGKTSYRNSNLLKRKLFDVLDVIQLALFCLKKTHKEDIIINYLNSISLERLVLITSHFSKTTIYRELCEYPYAPFKRSRWIKLKQWTMLHYIFPKYSGFMVISENLKIVAQRYGSSIAKILKVPILINQEEAMRTEAFKSEVPYLFHAGTLSEQKDAILSTLQAYTMALKQLEFPVKFYIAGDDRSEWTAIESIIKTNQLEEYIVFLGRIPQQKALSYWKGASLAILNKNNNVQNRYGFSTKLGEILLSETAVITTTVGEANYYLKDGVSAYIVEPHQPVLIAQKIVQAFTFPEERKKIAETGKRIAETEFDSVYQGKRMIEFLQNY